MYTQIPDTNCKGWSRTSFDDCKQKCINNDMPDSCDRGYGNMGCKVSKGGNRKLDRFLAKYTQRNYCFFLIDGVVIPSKIGTLWV